MTKAEAYLRESEAAKAVRRYFTVRGGGDEMLGVLDTLLDQTFDAGGNAAREWAAKECELGAQRQKALGCGDGVVLCTNLAAHMRSGKTEP